MGVALANASVRDAHELGALLEIGDRLGAEVPHAGAKTANKLMDNGFHRTLVGHLAFNTFRHQFQGIADFGLKIAIR